MRMAKSGRIRIQLLSNKDAMPETLMVWLYIQPFSTSTVFRPYVAASVDGWTIIRWAVERIVHLIPGSQLSILTETEVSGHELKGAVPGGTTVVTVEPGSSFQVFLRAAQKGHSTHSMFLNLAVAFGPDDLLESAYSHHCSHSNAHTCVRGLPQGLLVEIYDNAALAEIADVPFPYQPKSLASAFELVGHLSASEFSRMSRQTPFNALTHYQETITNLPEYVTINTRKDAEIAMELLKRRSYRLFPLETGLSPFTLLREWRELSLDRQRAARTLHDRGKRLKTNGDRRCRCVFFVGSSAMSGGEQSLCCILEKLAMFGVDCYAVVPYTGVLSKMLMDMRVQVTVLESDPEDGDIEQLRGAVAFLREVNPDVVHFNGPHTSRLLSLMALSMMIPIVIHVRIKVHWSFADVLRRADRVIAISNFVRQDLQRLELLDEDVHTVYNGIADVWHKCRGLQSLARERLGLSKDEVLLLTVVRFDPYKRIETAIDVLRELRRNGMQSRLLVLGERCVGSDDVYYVNVIEHARQTGLASYVELLGYKEDLRPYYEAADVLLATAEGEPFGRSLVEALAVGLPVVAADSGGHREIIEAGVSGMLCPVGDALAFSSTIRHLLSDPALRASLSAEGTARARLFNANKSAMQMANIIHDLSRQSTG